jgi:NADH-quinone oxidoreductase subunit M
MYALSLLTWLPLVGGIALLFVPEGRKVAVRTLAAMTSGATLIVSLWIWAHFAGTQTDFQLVEKVSWIPAFNVHYFIGVDGVSLPLLVLTTLLSLLAIIASFHIENRVKEYFFFFLLLETAMLGVFLALDLFLFYVFWELTLIPMYFLIGIWGGPRREFAAIKFFLFTFFGSIFMLVGILALYFHSQPHTFDYTQLLLQSPGMARQLQLWIFVGLFLGFAVKVPLFPLHTWLPVAHVEAPTAISVILAGVLLKMGVYGLLRFSFPLLPTATHVFIYPLAIIAVINVVYGAVCALAQTDIKRMIAYSSINHMGYVLLGMVSLLPMGFNGAVLQMVNHGIISGALFLLVGVIYDRAHTRDIQAFGGLGAQMPVYTGFMMFACFASLGLPLLSGFVGEFLCLLAAFHIYPYLTALSLIGVLLTAAFFLIFIRKVFMGPLNKKWASLKDMDLRELAACAPLVVLMIVLGVWPSIILGPINETLAHLVELVNKLPQ